MWGGLEGAGRLTFRLRWLPARTDSLSLLPQAAGERQAAAAAAGASVRAAASGSTPAAGAAATGAAAGGGGGAAAAGDGGPVLSCALKSNQEDLDKLQRLFCCGTKAETLVMAKAAVKIAVSACGGEGLQRCHCVAVPTAAL